jgi:hypothetical protein
MSESDSRPKLYSDAVIEEIKEESNEQDQIPVDILLEDK